MTNLTLRSLDIPTLHKHAIGFDSMFDRLLSATANPTTNYPPYNIVKDTEDKYRVEIAVAGFKQGEIDVTVEKNTLTVIGDKISTQEETQTEYLHKGISARGFSRVFTIGEHVEVKDAKVEDGVLTVYLEREIPEEKKPKKIAINYANSIEAAQLEKVTQQ
jgi:molecular chaperone IbpA